MLVILWLYRAELKVLKWHFSWLPVAAGGVVAVLWLVWSRGAALGDSLLLGARVLTLPDASAWIIVATIGALLGVPLAEELAFHGYVARRLIDPEFENVPFAQFSWLGFLGSSIAFGLIHVAWLPATLAAMIYAGLMYRSGRLADAILANFTSCGRLLLCALTLR